MAGAANFSGLAPSTGSIPDATGLPQASVGVGGRQRQAITVGLNQEFSDTSAVVFDVPRADSVEFKRSDICVDGDQLLASVSRCDDIFAFPAGYPRRIGVAVLQVDDTNEDDDRTLSLGIDSMWSAGIGVWWQWKEDLVIAVALNCLEIDDAATTSQELPTAAP